MNSRHFGDYIDNFEKHGDLTALTARPFLVYERRTYRELKKEIYQTAHYLVSEGVTTGDRIMIVAVNSPQWIVLFLAAQCMGVAVVPVDVRSNAEAAFSYAEQTTPKLIFLHDHTLPGLEKSYKTCSIDSLRSTTKAFPITPPNAKLTGKETAVIVFTSGTTAAPKGVVLSQHNILANITGVLGAITPDSSWQLMSVLPLSHMFELTASLVVLTSGAGIDYLNTVTPATIAGGFRMYHPTVILAVPELLSVLLERIRQGAEASGKTKLLATLMTISAHLPFTIRHALFGSVHKQFGGRFRIAVVGGAPVPVETARAWELMGVRIVQGYGLTETSPILTVNGLNDRRIDSQGKVLHNIKLRIAKTDGEIQAKGPSIFAGYWQNPSATKDAFTDDGWFRTGDVGKLEGEWLHIQGRAKFTIVLASGLKVFPEDVETAAYGIPNLRGMCVTGLKHPHGETVAAVIVSDASDTAVNTAIAEVNAKLQPFQHITSWERWPDTDFPRTRLLKVDRKAVQAWLNDQTGSAQVAAKESHEQATDKLLACLRLSVDKPNLSIKPTDRLADLGLDSLRRLNLVLLIEEQLGKAITETAITPALTVAKLRQVVEKASSSKAAAAPQSNWQFNPIVRTVGNIIRDTLGRGITRLWVQQRTIGLESLPKSNAPVIFMFNHVDNFDGPVAYFSLPRRIRRRLAVGQAEDFMQGHAFISFMSQLCFAGYAFARQAPFMPSLEHTAELVDRGWNIALFPEGEIGKTAKLRKFKSGIGLLAVELGVPIIPVKTTGLYGTLPYHTKWPKKHSRVTVTIGKPVTFTPEMAYDKATRQLEDIMRDL